MQKIIKEKVELLNIVARIVMRLRSVSHPVVYLDNFLFQIRFPRKAYRHRMALYMLLFWFVFLDHMLLSKLTRIPNPIDRQLK